MKQWTWVRLSDRMPESDRRVFVRSGRTNGDYYSGEGHVEDLDGVPVLVVNYPLIISPFMCMPWPVPRLYCTKEDESVEWWDDDADRCRNRFKHDGGAE